MSILSMFNIPENIFYYYLTKRYKRARLICYKSTYTLFSIALAIKEYNLDLVLIYNYLALLICNFANIIFGEYFQYYGEYIIVLPLLLS